MNSVNSILNSSITKSTKSTKSLENKSLINNQALKLKKSIANDGLYRKGLQLYEVEKIRPRYSIAEYCWCRCSHPLVASKVSDRLEEILEDTPKLKKDTSNFDEINNWITSQWDNIEDGYTKKPNVNLCRFLHLYLNKNVLPNVLEEDVEHVGSILNNLLDDFPNWEPLEYFVEKYNAIVEEYDL